MDLSFPGFDKDAEVTRLPGDLAVLMVGIAARQHASATATAQARFGRMYGAVRRLQPACGAFNGPVALLLAHWQVKGGATDMKGPFTAALQPIFKRVD